MIWTGIWKHKHSRNKCHTDRWAVFWKNLWVNEKTLRELTYIYDNDKGGSQKLKSLQVSNLSRTRMTGFPSSNQTNVGLWIRLVWEHHQVILDKKNWTEFGLKVCRTTNFWAKFGLQGRGVLDLFSLDPHFLLLLFHMTEGFCFLWGYCHPPWLWYICGTFFALFEFFR